MNNLAEKKTRVRKSREDRMAEIIGIATGIFTREGYSELTLRRVAKEAGIRLSTVQYYFDSKEKLLNALLMACIKQYKSKLLAFQAEAHGDFEQQLSRYIRYLLSVSDDPDTCGFFTQLWAMGFQQEECREVLSYTYSTHREDLASLINAARPELSHLECLQRATIISSMIEGSLVHLGCGLPRKPEFEGIRERMFNKILSIALE